MHTINTREFFSNYLFHPLSQDLSLKEKVWITISSIALNIFSLGAVSLISYLIFSNKTYSVLDRGETREEKISNIKDRVLNNSEAQYKLSCLFIEGTDEEKIQAVLNWELSALQGHPLSQFCLGIAFSEGIGTKKNNEDAIFWLKKAADQAVYEADAKLGELISKSDEKAKGLKCRDHWQKSLNEKENELLPSLFKAKILPKNKIQYLLGHLYEMGAVVPKSLNDAANFYKTSKIPEANFRLGILYEIGPDDKGHGLEKNERKAIAHFSKVISEVNNESLQKISHISKATVEVYKEALQKLTHIYLTNPEKIFCILREANCYKERDLKIRELASTFLDEEKKLFERQQAKEELDGIILNEPSTFFSLLANT